MRISPEQLSTTRSLEQQRREFASRPFLAMPVAGMIAWAAIGLAGAFLPVHFAVWAVFIGTGSIFYLGLLVARFTGEDLLGRTREKNVFDSLFMHAVGMAWLVFAIAVPFALAEPTSVPLTVGILAGLMWIPFSWIVQHWVGLFHGVARTVLLLAAWYAFPDDRFVILPAIIVAIYAFTIAALILRQPAREPATA